MKTFIASGFGAGILWRTFFGEKKGGGSFASLVYVIAIPVCTQSGRASLGGSYNIT